MATLILKNNKLEVNYQVAILMDSKFKRKFYCKFMDRKSDYVIFKKVIELSCGCYSYKNEFESVEIPAHLVIIDELSSDATLTYTDIE